MKLNNLIATSIILLTLPLSGCNKEAPQSDVISDTQQEQSATSVTTDTDVETTSDKVVVDTNTETEPSIEQVSMSMLPLDEYHDVNIDSDNAWVTPLFIAQTTRELTDEDKLNFLSSEYYNETDVFKKKELEQTLLPQIQQQIAQYEGDYRIKAPITNGGNFYKQQQEKNLTYSYIVPHIGIESYDFDSQSFPMQGCDNLDFGVLNEQRMSIQPIGTSGVRERDLKDLKSVSVEECKLDVSDEQLARRIEEARATNNIGIKGTMYFYLKGTDNYVVSYPEFADLTFYDKTTGETLFDKELHFKIVVDAI